MTAGLYDLDRWLFETVNRSCANPVFDALMPFLSGNAVFIPAVVLGVLGLLWWGGRRGRVCVLLLALAIAVTDGVVCKNLKSSLARPRPFKAVPDTILRVGAGESGSMPSSHAANWFAAIVVLGAYYRRSLRWTVPIGLAVGFSRIYNGVHYPSDVLVGMLLGAGAAWGVLRGGDGVYRWAGGGWFPLWHSRLPSLRVPDAPAVAAPAVAGGEAERARALERHWLSLGYVAIAAMLLFRWLYLASGRVELSEDEAYQWTWSKHLALSYFSKPPMIAYAQFIGTSLWGDTAFGVRFLSPLISALLGGLLLRFIGREVGGRPAFWMLCIANTAPLMTAGSMLMTIDPLSVLFWVAALCSGWRAVQEDRLSSWLWTGLWMGCGFLSKYTGLFQLLSWAVFFALYPPARARLRGRGPWLALGISLLCTLPVWVWNARHDWITVTHVASNGGLNKPWQPQLKFLVEFTAAEFGLLNPVFFVGALWAAVGLWRMRERRPLTLFLFSMGAPVFLFYWLYTLRYRVQANWIAPAALPLFALMVVYWEERWRQGARAVPRWLGIGVGWGALATVLMLYPELLAKGAGRPWPPRWDPLRRIRAWSQTAQTVENARQTLQAEGRPTFIIADHYGLTGQCSFYIPEAKATVRDRPLVFFRTSDHPENQYFFWPGYRERKGQNAILVCDRDEAAPPPAPIEREFESVQDLGVREVLFRGQVYRRVQLFACRGLR